MGRKIPAKKHRGVKDPLEQQARRLQSLKSKINAPPRDPDEQPVPRSLTRLFAFREHDVTKKVTKKKKVLHGVDKRDKRNARGVGVNPVSQLRKLPGESGRAFSLRINSAMRALHTNDDHMDYPQDMEEEDDKGMRMAAQRERRARRRRAAPPPQPARPPHEGGRAAQPRQGGRPASPERRELVYEHVPFGEVSHAPSALPLPRAALAGAGRPGRRPLLLSALLRPRAEAVEAARRAAVEAYRSLKAAKLRHNNTGRPRQPVAL